MKLGESALRDRRRATLHRYGTSTLRRYLFAVTYALVVALVVLRTVLVRDAVLHVGDLSTLASRKQFPGFQMWDPLAQQQVIINHLVFDPWLAFFEPVVAQRISLLVLFFLLPFVSFVGFRGLLGRHFDRYLTASALLGSLLYTVNPIVVVRSRHYFLLWFYAFLPILFYYTVELSADADPDGRSGHSTDSLLATYARPGEGAPDTTWVKIAVVLFLMSGSVRMPFYFLVPLFVVLAYASAPYGRYLWRQTRRWVAIFGLYFLLTAVWSYPYVLRTISGSAPSPAGNRYIVTEQVLSLLSQNATVPNVLMLRAYWGDWLFDSIFGIESRWLLVGWELSVAVIVGLTALGALLYVREKREVVALSALFFVVVFLAKGTNPPFPDFYGWLVLDSPLSRIGWQFRGANKWNLLVMFCYATLSVFAISWLLRTAANAVDRSDHGRRREVATVATIGLVLAVVFATAGFPLLSGHLAHDAGFVTPSSNYRALIEQGDDYKVHTHPLAARRLPTGTPGQRGTTGSQYYQYAMTESADTQRYLARANVGHVYVTRFPRGTPTGGIDPDSALTVSRPSPIVTAHGRSTYSFTFPYLRQQPTIYGTAQISDRTERSLHRSDVVVVNDRPPVPFLTEATVIAPMDHTRSRHPSAGWRKASTDDPIHGTWHPYLQERGMQNWQFDYDRGLVFSTDPDTAQTIPDDANLEPLQGWEFSGPADVAAWNRTTPRRQFGAVQELNRSGDALSVELRDATAGWKEVRAPPVPVSPGDTYRLRLRVRGTDTHEVHLKVAELDEAGRLLRIEQVAGVGNGTFDWRTITTNYTVRNDSTTSLRLEIWHGSETTEPLPNTLWIDDVRWADATGAASASVDARFTVDDATEYKLFARHFESRRGGELTLALDGNHTSVNTTGPADQFVWTDLGTHRLDGGEHELRLANERGFNAVNLFVLVPVDEYREQQRRLDRLLRNRTVVYAYEAERGFETSGGSAQVPLDEASVRGAVHLGSDDAIQRRIEVDRPGRYTLAARGAGSFDVRLGNESYAFRQSDVGTESLGSVRLDEGSYDLAIENVSPTAENEEWSVATYDFENEVGWTGGSSQFTVRLSEDAYRGNSSLSATTSNTTRSWSWVYTESTEIAPERRYAISTHVKHRNVDESHALLVGYNTTTGEWQRLGSVFPSTSGTSNWTTYRTVVEVPRNVTRVKFALNAGVVRDPARGNATTWFDDFTVTSTDGDRIDAIWLYDAPRNGSGQGMAAAGEGTARVERVEQVSPTRYRVRVNGTEPYLLSFAEGYDPLWVAEVRSPNGSVERHAPVPLYATTNGFWIDETGEHTVTIRYRPQRWFHQGAVISGVALLASLAYLLYGWRRRRGDGWAEQVGQRVDQWRRTAAGVLHWR